MLCTHLQCKHCHSHYCSHIYNRGKSQKWQWSISNVLFGSCAVSSIKPNWYLIIINFFCIVFLFMTCGAIGVSLYKSLLYRQYWDDSKKGKEVWNNMQTKFDSSWTMYTVVQRFKCPENWGTTSLALFRSKSITNICHLC